MGQLIAGPFCGQLLADMGAEVIKVEPPGIGDPMRSWGRGDLPLWWETIARNKKSVSIDLRLAAGQELVRSLIGKADILVENFRPGTLERWGLGPDVLQAHNVGLIVVRMSGYGQTGPYAQRASFGAIGEAMGGLRYIVGESDRPPSRIGISIGDSLCATFGCVGALAALHSRESTGLGQVVDAALYESVLQIMESLIPDYALTGHIRERSGAILPGIAPSNVYQCQDGEIVLAANQDAVFLRLCAAMNRPSLAGDARFSGHLERGRHQKELDEIIGDWTRLQSVAELESLLAKHAVPAGQIYRAPEMLADPQFAARAAIVELEHPRWGRLKMQNVFPKLSLTPGSVRSPAPERIGQHNTEIFQGLLGLTAVEMQALTSAGVT